MSQETPNSNAERYRRRATELRTLAKNTTDPLTKQEFEGMARQYDRLADNAKAHDL